MALKIPLIEAHWYHLIDGLEDSPQRFYTVLEEGLKRRQLPDIKISRVDFREGNILSAKRTYLRVVRNQYMFDVCAATFGKSFYVSWWRGEKLRWFRMLLMMIPMIGYFFMHMFRPKTYYQNDVALMFQESVHVAVLEVVDDITKAKGLRILSESDRKPVLGDLKR